MNREDIIRMAHEARFYVKDDEAYSPSNQEDHELTEYLERFAALVASAEREKLRGQIETLGAMYELASRQRDELMAQQRADIEAVRRKMQ